MFHRPRMLLGIAIALGTRIASSLPIRPTEPAGHTTHRKASPSGGRAAVRTTGLLERRRWLIRWAPPGGGHRERTRRRRQIQAGTLTRSNGLVPFHPAG